MVEVSIKCPTCGKDLKGPGEDELARAFREHSLEHGLELSEEEAKAKVRMLLENP